VLIRLHWGIADYEHHTGDQYGGINGTHTDILNLCTSDDLIISLLAFECIKHDSLHQLARDIYRQLIPVVLEETVLTIRASPLSSHQHRSCGGHTRSLNGYMR